MKKNKMTFEYDDEADVLYVSFGEPQKAITEERKNIAIRRNEKTKELVGITIIDFLKKTKGKSKTVEIEL